MREIVGHEQLEVPVRTRKSALTGILHTPRFISTSFLILIEKIKDYYLLSTKVNQDRAISSLHRKTLAEWEHKPSNPVLNPLNHNSSHLQIFCSPKLAGISQPSSCKRPNIWSTAAGAELSHETCRDLCHLLFRIAAHLLLRDFKWQ